MTELFKIDEAKTSARLESFLKAKLAHSEMKGFVIGLSGGIDSSLSAAIAVRAVGPNNVTGFILPYTSSAQKSEEDARELADNIHIKVHKIPISPMIEAYFPNIKKINPVRAGNKMARERMSVLFDKSFEYDSLVLGTSNRTEICLGYGTWYGDMGCSINPIGNLYKTHVRQMAKYYDLPKSILHKAPSADLWPGQTDEKELGLTYDIVDRLLYLLIEKKIRNKQELHEEGFENAFIDRTVGLINRFYYKRHVPEIADLGLNEIPDKITLD